MRVIIGGERFGVIRDAFNSLGHDAWSCDLVPAEGKHLLGDWWNFMDDGWDLGIFHPTCTYMSNSSSKHLYRNMEKREGLNDDRWIKMGRAAWKFWELLNTSPLPRVAIENPIMLGYAQHMVGEPTQIVQPWWFGNDEDGPDNVKKATCLWLKDLPPLAANSPLFTEGYLDGSTARADCHNAGPTKDPEVRRMLRSKTPPGIAMAMAEQWGSLG
jgi:hypothetical protein